MEYTEAKVLKLKHFPDNPLQHTDIETTRKYYAQPGSDDIHEARERLFQEGCRWVAPGRRLGVPLH